MPVRGAATDAVWLALGILALSGLYLLANAGERNRTARILALIAGGVLAGAALTLGALTAVFEALQYAVGLVSGSQYRTVEEIAIPVAISGLLGIIYLIPAVQRAVSRVVPLRAGSPVSYLTVVVGLVFVASQLGSQLAINVLDVLKNSPPLSASDLLYQDLPLVVLSFAGVGILVRRTPAQAIERLGLLPPRSARWWPISVGLIVVFIAVAYGIEYVAGIVTPQTQKQVTDVTNALFSHFNTPVTIVFLGLLAGIVEEVLFRGALVPRLGVVVSALLFAALHTQYGITFASLEVFVLGVGLGWLRTRAGTLPCIVTHAGYDIAVGFLSLLAH